jgi:aldehyde:ferredoxin oxidoreductase
MDETVLPYFQEPELHQNVYLDRRHSLDRERFRPVQDAFYALHGWDAERGWPTEERLRELGMEDVYQDMIDGAARAVTIKGV